GAMPGAGTATVLAWIGAGAHLWGGPGDFTDLWTRHAGPYPLAGANTGMVRSGWLDAPDAFGYARCPRHRVYSTRPEEGNPRARGDLEARFEERGPARGHLCGAAV